jgi:hypothetical protein
MSDPDEEVMLFGEEENPETDIVAIPDTSEPDFTEVPVMVEGRFPVLSGTSRIVKFPSSALSVAFDGRESKSAVRIQCRTSEETGEVESNARLIEWEDGSWSLVVGTEHFRVIERDEDVVLFDKQPSGYQISVGSVGKQFNVIPASLDSRTHRHVVEQSAVARKLNETRKVALAHGLAATTGGASVNTIAVQPEALMAKSPGGSQKRSGQKLTAAFLEAGMPSKERGLRDIKASFKKQRIRGRQEESEDEEPAESDVDFIDDDEASSSEESSSSVSGSDSEGSSSSSSSGSSSSSSSSSSDSE